MNTNLTNLLPPERRRVLMQLYFLRLGVVAALLLAVVVVAHGILLLPSYLYVREQVAGREAALASLTAALVGSEGQEVSGRVTALAEDSAYLARLATQPKASAALRAMLALPYTGIHLTGFAYAVGTESAPGRMTVSGSADTREALRRYVQALASQPYIETANLPISAYAQEQNIPFVITLTGSFTP